MKGVGKNVDNLARILAKALNCEKGPAVEPCNRCRTCAEITEGNSTDYMEIDGASNNGVNEVRSLRETVKYKPLKMVSASAVIDEAHMLSTAAWKRPAQDHRGAAQHYFDHGHVPTSRSSATIVSALPRFRVRVHPLRGLPKRPRAISRRKRSRYPITTLDPISGWPKAACATPKDPRPGDRHFQRRRQASTDGVAILRIIDEQTFINLTRQVLPGIEGGHRSASTN